MSSPQTVNLTRMNQEELTFRSYYRMMQKLDRCNEEEQLYRQKTVRASALPKPRDTRRANTEHDGRIHRHDRFPRHAEAKPVFSPFLYQHENFEMFYIHSGQCTHICKGQEYLLKQGDFVC